MRRRTLTGRDPHHQAVNVTPLIDVVMCLIIFFLIVGKLAGDRGAMVRLPESVAGADESSPAVLIVTIAKDPLAQVGAGGWAALAVTVQVDGELVADAKELEAAVRGRLLDKPTASVQIRADRELSFGAVEPVLRACGLAGAKTVKLATERAS